MLLLTSTVSVSGQFTVCSGKQCSPPCYAIEGSDCSCIPKGCDGSLNNSLSIDVLDEAFCKDGKVLCKNGSTPACRGNDKDLKPVCGGWLFGFGGGLSGPGCAKRFARKYSYFDKGAIYCRTQKPLSPDSTSCKKKTLCDRKSKRKKSCRDDRVLCKCVCPFRIKNQKNTPSCDENDKPTCPKNLSPICSLPGNIAGCEGGKLFCKNVSTGAIDLLDKILCK